MQFVDTLKQYPREELTRTPTPLQHLKQLSQHTGPDIYIKRDDLTDLTLGGDKPRKLEYEVAHARQQGADTLVSCGSAQSNHARLTAAAARRVGMDCAFVLTRDPYAETQGNLLTVRLMGAQIVFVDVEDHWDLEEHALALCDQLREEGKEPHYIPVSGTTPRSCLGYVRGGLETIGQLSEMGVEVDAFYTPFGTGGIFAATLLTLRAMGYRTPVIGISVNRRRDQCQVFLDRWWSALIELLDVDPDLDRGAHEILDTYIGSEYGDPTEASLDAILTMAQTEGILLDPVYSGKVTSGLLDHCQQGRWTKRHSLLLLHSGGVPSIFAYQQVIEDHLRRRGIMNC